MINFFAYIPNTTTTAKDDKARVQELIKYAATITAVANRAQDKESQALAAAYKPLDSLLQMSHDGPDLNKTDFLLQWH